MITWNTISPTLATWNTEVPDAEKSPYFLLIDNTHFFLIDNTYRLIIDSPADAYQVIWNTKSGE